MSQKRIKRVLMKVKVKDLRSEDGAAELASSEDMQPYIRYLELVAKGSDPTPGWDEIARLPLEQRYVWRVASALKWGFADFDSESVKVDKETLTPEDFAKLMELLTVRPMQFCLLLKALVGVEEMQRMTVYAIKEAG